MKWTSTAKWVAALYIANVADMVLTTYWSHAYQIQEANPLLHSVWLLEPSLFVLIKVVAVGLLAGFLVLTVSKRWHRSLLVACTLIYVICVGYHLGFGLYLLLG